MLEQASESWLTRNSSDTLGWESRAKQSDTSWFYPRLCLIIPLHQQVSSLFTSFLIT